MQHPFFWGSVVPGDDRLRHEPALYLSLNGLFLFFVIWSLRKKIQTPGRLAFLFFIWEGFSRFFLDFFRANDLPGLSDPRFWGLTISQHLSIAMFLIAGFFFLFPKFYLRKRS
jgi:phosphatidylglycerol:prolipoprotein diacylglycerol transferase